ncbi:mechanosensitive ion channel family protein [Mangrovibacterium diazotrophicum]|uniref:Small conductance mechanosensitive channel n=1 Tax=Mangrovibacterium diazotrophicum TaxID=1261403 RepID=A0A419WAJ2_9BACT|nr:mechanosensitive ion channel domain-containing protein [Mangrovibacterium diazotrophicum]RKD92422.1 small conductance mechanosensitive channel [Mangrovibacterium diazotrophicum]
MENYQNLIDKALEIVLVYGPKIVLAILVLIIGLWIINRFTKVIRKVMTARNVNISLIGFVASLANLGLKALLLISVAGMIGIQTTSFIAVLGAAGLAIGLALQGTLANFAGGVMILIFKPYQVGDLIQAQGHLGVVKEIHIFVTTLLSPENKTIIIPNGAISNGDITNFVTEGKIRVDMTFGISYESNIKQAKEILMKVMTSHPLVMKEPTPFVGVKELADSSVNLAVRPYTEPGNYWAVYFDVYEQGKIALDEGGVTIPFPQVDVHMKQS